MRAPDKIYIPLCPNYSLDGFHLADEWMYEPHKECDNVTYIRKDALLGWIKDQLKENAEWREVNPDDRFFGGKEVAFERLIDKINSL